MIPLILTFGCLSFLSIGTGLAAWAGIDAQEELDIKNIIIISVGIVITAFSIFCIIEASKYYHEKESPKTEITTSIPAQIDTIITIRNNVSDTSYIYKFSPKEQ